MHTLPRWVGDHAQLADGWNAFVDESGEIERYIFIGEGRGMTRMDQSLVDHSAIHRVTNDLDHRRLLSAFLTSTFFLARRTDLDEQIREYIKRTYRRIEGHCSMTFGGAAELAEEPLHQVEQGFNRQFLNLDELRITGPLAWSTVQKAHNTVQQFLSFRIPGIVAALRLLGIHMVHYTALLQWSSQAHVFEYLNSNFDHLHRRAFVLLDRSCMDATLGSAGQMHYLAHLYGATALFLNGILVFAQEDPERFYAGESPTTLDGVLKGRKSKAVDELLAHRAVPAFSVPALAIAYEGMSNYEREELDWQGQVRFIYPQLMERVAPTDLKGLSQQELFDQVRSIHGELNDVDVISSVTYGEDQPIDLDSLEVFSVQQLGRNLMLLATGKGRRKDGERPEKTEPDAQESGELANLRDAVFSGKQELANRLLKQTISEYAGLEAAERGYIETVAEANAVPCRVLRAIHDIFSEYNESRGPGSSYYLFSTDTRYPGEAWGGYGALVWLGYEIGHRLGECGIIRLRSD
jgi:hypothetical protein